MKFGLVLLVEEILHQLRLVVYPIIYKVLYIPGGCSGFLPSKVSYKLPLFLRCWKVLYNRGLNPAPLQSTSGAWNGCRYKSCTFLCNQSLQDFLRRHCCGCCAWWARKKFNKTFFWATKRCGPYFFPVFFLLLRFFPTKEYQGDNDELEKKRWHAIQYIISFDHMKFSGFSIEQRFFLMKGIWRKGNWKKSA